MYKAGYLRLWLVVFVLIGLAGCSDGKDSPPDEERIGFEIIQILAPNELRAWISPKITRKQFEALEVPAGWIKNQPREGGEKGGDSTRFLRSPDAAADDEFLVEEFFGFEWFHAATVVQAGRPMDDEGILTGSSVRKFHEVTYNAGSNLALLISPEGLVYFRIGRDANRETDEPTIPDGWRLLDYTTTVELVIELFPRNTVIRSDNQDSFQGPVLIEELIASGVVPNPLEIPPLELKDDTCDNAINMAIIQDSLIWRAVMAASELNPAQVARMVAEPTRGPFYMLNLIRYREFAEYRDGRETNLTGREANALYAPLEFLAAIGAGPIFFSPVDEQIDGSDYIWEEFALVEYPCPAGFFSMILHPGFQARVIHKDAGVEKTIVMVTHLRPLGQSTDIELPPPTHPPTLDDPSFELVHVMDFHDIAKYEPGADEPERTGAQAWAEFQAGGSAAATVIGVRLSAIFDVQGVLTGDTERSWNQANLVYMPSMAGFQALIADATREAGSYHREAALANNYSLIMHPVISNIPDGSDGPLLPPVTDTGVGTLCNSDADCVGIGFCLKTGDETGICSRMCGSGECGDGYVCCHACSELAAPLLPFEGSACMFEAAVGPLSSPPVSCTCE